MKFREVAYMYMYMYTYMYLYIHLNRTNVVQGLNPLLVTGAYLHNQRVQWKKCVPIVPDMGVATEDYLLLVGGWDKASPPTNNR